MKANGFKNDCCGCGACVSVCPVGAVQIKINDFGFYAAAFDLNICIDCGRCGKVCPIGIKVDSLLPVNNCNMIAATIKDETVHNTCASGGVAAGLTSYALSSGIKVTGAVYFCETGRVKTVIADNENEAENFRNSKYLQSNSAQAFREAIEDRQHHYLVIGLPCQIYGLNKVAELTGDSNRFIFVDLFCHGVPSYLVWDSYLKEKGIIDEKDYCVSFRDHIGKYDEKKMTIRSSSVYVSENRAKCSFYQAFDDNYLMNDCCYRCNLSQLNSMADIRIGDIHEENGTKFRSRVILMTQNGADFFEHAQDRFYVDEYARKQTDENLFPQHGAVCRRIALEKLKKGAVLKEVVVAYRRREPLKLKVWHLTNKLHVYSLFKRVQNFLVNTRRNRNHEY